MKNKIHLTARENEVAARIARALPQKVIAGELLISQRTVETHLKNIRLKTGTASAAELAVFLIIRKYFPQVVKNRKRSNAQPSIKTA